MVTFLLLKLLVAIYAVGFCMAFVIAYYSFWYDMHGSWRDKVIGAYVAFFLALGWPYWIWKFNVR